MANNYIQSLVEARKAEMAEETTYTITESMLKELLEGAKDSAKVFNGMLNKDGTLNNAGVAAVAANSAAAKAAREKAAKNAAWNARHDRIKKLAADNIKKNSPEGRGFETKASIAKYNKDKAVDFVKNHKKQIGIGAGVAGAGIAAGIAAKKIYDKKKAAAAAREEVKENYEYDEFDTVIEAVISNFMSDEEVMSENCDQIAMESANYLIDNINLF